MIWLAMLIWFGSGIGLGLAIGQENRHTPHSNYLLLFCLAVAVLGPASLVVAAFLPDAWPDKARRYLDQRLIDRIRRILDDPFQHFYDRRDI